MIVGVPKIIPWAALLVAGIAVCPGKAAGSDSAGPDARPRGLSGGSMAGTSVDVDTNAFVTNQILGCPTDTSITITIVPKKNLMIYFEYGTAPGVFTLQSDTTASTANEPVRFCLGDLTPDVRYYYRIRYKEETAGQFVAGDQSTFHTRRSRGSTFAFTLTADSHLYDKKGSPGLMKVTMRNILDDNPDFEIELGDTFGDDRDPPAMTSGKMMQLHLNYLPYVGMVCHAAPFYFCLGNHEGESGYHLLQTPPDNIAVWGTLARKYYFANPVPDGFYTGDTTAEGYGMGRPENYYAWEWGDALFIVLDVYRYSTANAKPQGWDWTLGPQQYDWFKRTLENSSAKYKFVFAHHLRGQGRGAFALAPYFEWGGRNADSSWGFSANRPGWALPVHQVMAQNHVNIFFQGHDHLFAVERFDGIVYQDLPMPSDSTYTIGYLANADAYTDLALEGSGYVRVTVSPDSSQVEFVRSYLPQDTTASRHNREVAFSYSVAPNNAVFEPTHRAPSAIKPGVICPNPFYSGARIRYSLPAPGHVILKAFNALGSEVATLVDEDKQPGSYGSAFPVSRGPGGGKHSRLPSGIYFFQLKVNATTITTKAVLLNNAGS